MPKSALLDAEPVTFRMDAAMVNGDKPQQDKPLQEAA